MRTILDQIAESTRTGIKAQILPATASEFLALRIAQRLGDQSAVRHFIELADRFGDSKMLTAYRWVRNHGVHKNPGRVFQLELERLANRNEFTNGVDHHRLAAIRIERRAVAIAVFAGEHLDSFPMVRQLSSDSDKALSSAVAFVSRILEKRPFTAAALETLPEGEVQRTLLADSITSVLSARTVSIWRIPKRDVLGAFGHPPFRFRGQVRKAITNIFPEVNGSFGGPLIKDALALGLYCQIEHLLNL